jgi:hypothetical protein
VVAFAAGSARPGAKDDFQHFKSRPDLVPPAISVDSRSSATAPGFIFIGPKKEVKDRGTLILDNRGNVVWFRSSEPNEATDFKVQTYRGKPVLTWWLGKSDQGIGQGVGVIYNSSYRKIATVRAGHGLDADLHEFRLTPRGTALLTIYHRVPADLSSVGGPKNGFAQDSVLQEVDVATGKVRFEWHSIPQVPLGESYTPYRSGTTYDYFHINSAQLLKNGNYLISARNTRALYEISHRTHRIVWRLGGKKSSFKMGRGTTFAWQHDAELRPDGTLTVFDNEAQPPVGDRSRALVMRVNEKKNTVTLVHAYTHPDKVLAPHQGNFQLLGDGHAFVGWGGIPRFTEFNHAGKVVYDAHFSSNMDSYRAYRFVWHGRPKDKPRVAFGSSSGGKVALYVSWNGATDVTRWQVLAGKRGHLKPIRTVGRGGFETKITVKTRAPVVRVKALDGTGKALGFSAAMKRP